MKGKKKAVPPPKHQLKTADIKRLVTRWQDLESEMEPLEIELAQIKETLVADLDVKDALEFGPVTLRIMQGKTRTGLQWKKIAYGLAKVLYPEAADLRIWLKNLARKFPKKPTKAYARLFNADEKKEAA